MMVGGKRRDRGGVSGGEEGWSMLEGEEGDN